MRSTSPRGKRLGLTAIGALLLPVLTTVPPAAAEELILRNGQKIVGTIVGFENDMFRVETEFGFALIRKDKVATINLGSAGAKEAAQKGGDTKSRSTKTPAGNASKATARVESSAREADGLAVMPQVPPVPSSGPAAGEPPERAQVVPPAPEPAKQAPPPPAVSRPLDEPLPPSLQEHVEGTTYISDTFHFAMFKPPGWRIFEGVPKETGSAIVAIGTEDEQTLLFVDREVWSGTPSLKSETSEARLRKTYQEFQKLMESPTEVDSHPAIRRVFTGVVEGVEWHGLSVHVANGNTIFGIVGLTAAETFQFQQALFNKIVHSFHFLNPASPAPSAARPALPPLEGAGRQANLSTTQPPK